MCPATIRYLPLILFLGLGCASRATVPRGDLEAGHQLSAESWLEAYDRGEEHFLRLYHELEGKWGQDAQLIEARELLSVAEEFYLLAEYETAMEVLHQAIQLLEERRRGEETRP